MERATTLVATPAALALMAAQCSPGKYVAGRTGQEPDEHARPFAPQPESTLMSPQSQPPRHRSARDQQRSGSHVPTRQDHARSHFPQPIPPRVPLGMAKSETRVVVGAAGERTAALEWRKGG